MDSQTVQALLNTAIRTATEHSRQEFQARIDELTSRLARIETPTQVVQYEPVTIEPNILCDLPSALALAQELEANQARSMFAHSFNRQAIQSPSHYPYSPQYRRVQPDQQRQTQTQTPVPMDIDPSLSRFRQNRPQPINGNDEKNRLGTYPRTSRPYTGTPGGLPIRNTTNQTIGQVAPRPEKRSHGSDQQPIQKAQRINNLVQEHDELEEEYGNDALHDNYYHNEEWNPVECQDEPKDDVNFLGRNPSCPMSSGQSGEEA